jgi:hypothetical protein
MENNGTAPIRVGTLYIKDKDNSEYDYFSGCLELFDSPGGVVINFESVTWDELGICKATYNYSYNDLNPITTNNINSYFLEIVYPTFNNGIPVVLDFIEAYNVNNPGEKKVGKVNKTNPISDTDPTKYDLFAPRSLVLANTPDQPNAELQQFIFMIANTPPDCEYKMNAANNGSTINCEPISVPGLDNGPDNASAALVPIDAMVPPSIISLTHNGQSHDSDIDYSQVTYFHYEGEENQPQPSV